MRDESGDFSSFFLAPVLCQGKASLQEFAANLMPCGGSPCVARGVDVLERFLGKQRKVADKVIYAHWLAIGKILQCSAHVPVKMLAEMYGGGKIPESLLHSRREMYSDASGIKLCRFACVVYRHLRTCFLTAGVGAGIGHQTPSSARG